MTRREFLYIFVGLPIKKIISFYSIFQQFYLDLNTEEEINKVENLLLKEQRKENLREISSIIQELGGYE